MTRSKYVLVFALWLSILLIFWLYLQVNGLDAGQVLQLGLAQLSSSPWGGLVLLFIFLLRPLLLLPVTVLNVFAGFLFGPVWGFIYALTATLASSAVAYASGRFFSAARPVAPHDHGWLGRLREHSFETILISRLVGVPGDLVNYAAGFWHISFPAFLGATALGGALSLLMVVLAGASIEGQFSLEGLDFKPAYLVASALLLLSSLGLSFYLRRRRQEQATNERLRR